MKFNRVLVIVLFLLFSVISVNAALVDDNVFGYWTANNTLTDSTGVTGKLVNSGATNSSDGIINNSLDVAGAGEDFLATDVNSATGATSISLWAKSDVSQTAAVYDHLFRWADSSSTGDVYCFWSYTNVNEMFCGFEDGSGGTMGSFTITKNLGTSYHHYLLVMNSTAAELFIDGVSEGSDYTLAGAIEMNNNMDLNFGEAKWGAAQSFDGTFDEMAVFNYSLDVTDAIELYNSGLGLAYPFGAADSAIVTSLKPFYNTSNITVQINATAIINLSYSLDGAAEVSVWTNQNNGSVNISSISNGLHNITWVGATSNISELFIIDLVVPDLNVTSPSTINRYRMNFSEVITFNDTNIDTCRVKVGGVFTTCINPAYNFSTNGNHSFNVTVNDSAGNINLALNNIVLVNPYQNFSFTNNTGGLISNFTFGGTIYPGSQAQLLTFGGGLSFGNNTLLFEKLGFQSTSVSFVINTTSHLNLTTSINSSQINLRFFDRETLVLITGTTTVTLVGAIGVNGTTTTGLFNISNMNFVTGTYQVIGSNPTYLTESVFFTFTGQEILQKDLFLLSNSSTDAGTVTIQVTASTGQFVQGAICSALEWRPSESAFISVAEGNTNTEGSTILNIEIGTKLYKFQCSKDGTSVTSPQQIIQTTESLIPLVLQIGSPAPVLLFDNLVRNLYNITLNATHQQIIYNFTSTDGLVTNACLIQYKQNGNFRSNLAESCVSSSNGQIQMIININQSYTQIMVATATQAGVQKEVDSLTFVGSLSLQSALSNYGFNIFLPLLVVIIGITVGFMLVPSNMAITSIVTLIGMWFLRFIVPGIMSTSSTIFMSVILVIIMWGSKR